MLKTFQPQVRLHTPGLVMHDGVCRWRIKMKKKFAAIVLTAIMTASLITACGGKSEAPATTPAPAAETKAETPQESKPEAKPETTPETTPAAEAESTADVDTTADEDSASGEFTLLDVSTDLIQTGVYATDDNGTELVFSMFTDPEGTPLASLFAFVSDADGNVSGDVICGTYTGESETDEDGITWTVLTVSDVYTGEDFTFGFGELEDQVYILNSETAYEGEYLSADDTITYMGTAAALLDE